MRHVFLFLPLWDFSLILSLRKFLTNPSDPYKEALEKRNQRSSIRNAAATRALARDPSRVPFDFEINPWCSTAGLSLGLEQQENHTASADRMSGES